MSYQFNYTLPPLSPPTPKVDPNAPIYAAEDGMVASLSSQECIFQLKRTGEPHVMTFQVLQTMDQCREFRTLAEHAARIQSTMPALAQKSDDVKRVLESLVQRQLLVSGESFVARLRAAAPHRQAPLRGIFIRACDRPEQLAHLLASLTDYERRFQVGRRYVLLDDSVLHANVNEQRDLLREFARTTGCKAHYIGSAERTKLMERFSKALPQARPIVSKLFQRETTPGRDYNGGRAKNLALLLSAGARMALLDDDLRLPLRRPEAARGGLDPNPNSHPLVQFYANMEESLAAGVDVVEDPFERNLVACGQALGALSDCSLDAGALRGLNLSRIDIIRGDARIVAVEIGSYGSSRSSSSLWLYNLNAETRREFAQERAQYLRNIEAHHIWYGVKQARVLECSGFTPFMFDNATLLPCTNPIGRGEDVLHGALIRYCQPDALTLQLPEALGHVQETTRNRSNRTLAAHVPLVNDFLHDFVRRQFGLFKAADPAQRLRFLAEVFRDLAGATTNDRISHLHEYLGYVRADTIDRLQHQLESAENIPVYWQADARRIVEANAKALLSKAPPRLQDWPEDIDAPGCAKALVTDLESNASMLEHWPAVWQHAAEQGEKLLGAL